jgi:DNA replication and repair protein RecF
MSGDSEQIKLEYVSQLFHQNLIQLLEISYEKDMILKRTTKGIHRDDINFKLSDIEFKKSGSQGQQKSFIYALKFAQSEWLFEKTNQKPIFLLDDFSDKLDAIRMEHLQDIINNVTFISQWFLTDTETVHFDKIIQKQIIKL